MRRCLPKSRMRLNQRLPALPFSPEELATWTDQALITEGMKTTWGSGDPRMEALAAEIERRSLDSNEKTTKTRRIAPREYFLHQQQADVIDRSSCVAAALTTLPLVQLTWA